MSEETSIYEEQAIRSKGDHNNKLTMTQDISNTIKDLRFPLVVLVCFTLSFILKSFDDKLLLLNDKRFS